jgi:hypothetical protein
VGEAIEESKAVEESWLKLGQQHLPKRCGVKIGTEGSQSGCGIKIGRQFLPKGCGVDIDEKMWEEKIAEAERKDD